MIFKRKKKKLENFDAIGLINDIALPLTPFGGKITNSDVVLRIRTHCIVRGKCGHCFFSSLDTNLPVYQHMNTGRHPREQLFPFF